MSFVPYAKPYITPAERIAHLQSRGLIVPHPHDAEARIERIGYERLRIYFRSRRQYELPERPFVTGTTYEDIIELYECDALLRNACFTAVGQFELVLRNTISEVLSRRYGAHPFFVAQTFRDSSAARGAMKLALDVIDRSKDARIAHYTKKYSDPMLPPIWTFKEVLTFGVTSRLFQLLSGPLRTEIARYFGVPKDQIFVNWVECLVDLRNICAHHDRLFNRIFQKQPGILRRAAIPAAPANRLKARLECLDHMMDSRGTPVGIAATVGAIVGRHPAMSPTEAGY